MQGLLLDAEIEKNGLTVLEMCNRTGISRSTYYRKRSGACAFDTKEIKEICKVLKIQEPRLIKEIFLDEASQ